MLEEKTEILKDFNRFFDEASFMKGMGGWERLYVFRRKCQAFFYGIPFFLCRLFPVKKNKIVLWTFEGTGGFGCSPRYIAEELLYQKKEGKNSYELYWIVADMKKEIPEGIRKIRDTHLNRAYHMTTARFWIGNTRTFYGTRKRKGTTYIQTWHGSLSLKPIGLYRGERFSRIAYIVSKADSDLIDVVLSGSEYCTKMWPKGLIYRGKIESVGTPRNDVLINKVKEKHIQLRKEYGLPQNAKIVIYAPTFRGGSQGTKRSISEGAISIDFKRVIETLEKRFGGVWYVFLRLHPQLAVFMEKMTISNEGEAADDVLKGRLIDVTQRPDMNEIMAATDAIITDYSTCLFEGFLSGQPGFIYADDWDEYVKDRGELMFSTNEIPFTVARDNEELSLNILKFDLEDYKSASKKFKLNMGCFEDGNASRRVVEMIESFYNDREL